MTTIGTLAAAGTLDFGDGYRTKRGEHGRPGFRILRVADLADGSITAEGLDFVAESYRRQIGGKLSEPGDVLLTTKGTIGRVAVMPADSDAVVYSPQLCYFRVRDSDALDPAYLRYWFQSEAFVSQASHRMNNTDMAAYINLADIRSLRLELPPIVDQRAIAEVLGALDDKIAANHDLKQTADELMSTRYEAALGGELRRSKLEEVAIFHNRRRIPLSAREREGRRGNVPYYGAAGVIDYIDGAIFNDQLLLVGEDGSVIKEDGGPLTQYVWGPSWVNNHAHVLSGTGISTEVLRLAVARTKVAALVTGAVQPKISMGKLKALELEIPCDGDLAALEREVQALTALHRSYVEEDAALARTRDELLPLLMSGKVRVRDAEQVVEGVL